MNKLKFVGFLSISPAVRAWVESHVPTIPVELTRHLNDLNLLAEAGTYYDSWQEADYSFCTYSIQGKMCDLETTVVLETVDAPQSWTKADGYLFDTKTEFLFKEIRTFDHKTKGDEKKC